MDLTSRLGINAADFGAGVKKATAGLGAEMKKAGDDAGKKLSDGLEPGLKATERKIQNTLKRAFSVTPDAGILDLDLPGLKASSAAMDAKAQRARELATAMAAVNAKASEVTQAQLLEARAAQNVADKFEVQARALQEELLMLERLQAELGQTAQLQERQAAASSAMAFGWQQIGFQAQDFFVQVQGGTPVLRALSQQLPQAIGALQMMGAASVATGGKFSGFLKVMSGPVGIALGVAIPLFGMLAEKMFDTADGADAAGKAAKNLGDGINFQKMSVDQLIKSINELEAAQQKQIRTSAESELAALRDAERSLQAAEAKRQLAIATLQALKASQQTDFAGLTGGTGGDIAQAAVQVSISNTERQIADLTKAAGVAARLVRETKIPIAERRAEARADPRKGITEKYNDEAGDQKAAYAAGKISYDQMTAALDNLAAAREKDLKALEKHKKGSEGAARAQQALAERGEDAAKKIANIADKFRSDDTSSAVLEANKALRELDDLADDFARKKPPNYEQLLQQLEEARKIVLASPGNKAIKAIEDELQQARERDADGIRDALQAQKDVADIEQICLQYGEASAARAQAELEIYRQYPAALASQLGILQQIVGLEAQRAVLAGQMQDDLQRIANRDQKNVQDGLDKPKEAIADLAQTFEDLFFSSSGNFWDKFERLGGETLSKLAANGFNDLIGGLSAKGAETLKRITGNAGTGAAAAGLTGGNGVGGMLGGGLGGELAKGLLKDSTAKIFGTALSSFAGPLGSVIGGVLGGVVGSLFKSAPKAGAVVTSVSGPAQIVGNDAAARTAVSGISNDVQSSLQRIVEALGGVAGSFDVSIGKWKDYYRVAPVATTQVSEKSWSWGAGASLLYDGTDAEEALRVAIKEAISDGAVQGVSDSVKRLLANNADIDVGLDKATRFQAAFKDLKELTDPIGAAMDAVNAKFRDLITLAKEAGASDEEMAQLEQLYKLQREEAAKTAGAVSDGLKQFLQSLKAGSSSPLSLRDQETNAKAALQPFIDKINTGQSVDTNAFQTAAQTFLQVERDLNGSSKAYFDQYNLVTQLTQKAIDQLDALASSADDAENPFDVAIAKSTQASADILDQINQQQASQVSLLEQIATAATGSADWWTAMRGY